MFDIIAYTNKSATNVVNKELTPIVTIQGVLKKGASILDPSITIQTDGSDVWRKAFNYMYISAFNRYYYVTNIISVPGTWESPTQTNPNTLWEVHGHVDVLMSYQNEIKQQTAVVARQEKQFNLMLDDGIFMSYQNPKIQTKLFSVANPFEQQEFVLIVAGS